MFLYGASGHGKVIKEILELHGRKVDGFIDDNPDINEVLGLPVFHTAEDADEVIVSIGFNAIRKSIVKKLDCKFASAAIHPLAFISDSATVGKGSAVMAGVIVNAEARIGKHCIINTGSTVDHECRIGDYAHIAPGVHLCGNVHVGEGTLIGPCSAEHPSAPAPRSLRADCSPQIPWPASRRREDCP